MSSSGSPFSIPLVDIVRSQLAIIIIIIRPVNRSLNRKLCVVLTRNNTRCKWSFIVPWRTIVFADRLIYRFATVPCPMDFWKRFFFYFTVLQNCTSIRDVSSQSFDGIERERDNEFHIKKKLHEKPVSKEMTLSGQQHDNVYVIIILYSG